jgi:hypothetical protein
MRIISAMLKGRLMRMISSVCLARARGKELFTVASFCIVPWEGSMHQDEEDEIVIGVTKMNISEHI